MVAGIVTGYLGTLVWWAYILAIVVSFVGGLPAGTQHVTKRGAALRGAVAGGVWSVALALTIQISGRDSVGAVSEPLVLIIPISIVVTAIASVTTWSVARRRRTSHLASDASMA
ncbi:hypothetical protein C6I20_02890 [Aeromicrobium sp. A1-2]|nr:hypothetical protein C6I20_02890 [Aeromicrobium sp. A1-2]